MEPRQAHTNGHREIKLKMMSNLVWMFELSKINMSPWMIIVFSFQLFIDNWIVQRLALPLCVSLMMRKRAQ